MGVVACGPLLRLLHRRLRRRVAVCRALDLTIEWRVKEGSHLPKDVTVVAVVSGPARRLLLAERTALNILARASGIATAARRVATLAKEARWHGMVAGTRKTTPGFRLVEKHALLVGGAATHRLDLSQATMLKDNHIWSAGSITAAVRRARTVCGFSSKIEVECGSISDALEAVRRFAAVLIVCRHLTRVPLWCGSARQARISACSTTSAPRRCTLQLRV